jgi:malate dehydrogenase
MSKVSIFGAGNVGATAAQYLVMKNIASVVLIDNVAGVAEGKALDLLQTGSVSNHSRLLTGSDNYELTEGSDIVVITAGVARKPNMSRDDLLKINAAIVKSVAEKAVKYSPDAIFIIVTNPLDVMTQLAWQSTGLPWQRVIGMAGVLDSARFQTFIANELQVSQEDVRAMVLGGHGDLMVPLIRHASVNGIPLTDLVSAERIEALSGRTRDGGAEIVKLLKTGSAFFAPGASVALMVEAILHDSKRLVPCSVLAPQSWGLPEVFIGLPVVLGRNGIERVVPLQLNDGEKAALLKSALSIRENVVRANELLAPKPAEAVLAVAQPEAQKAAQLEQSAAADATTASAAGNPTHSEGANTATAIAPQAPPTTESTPPAAPVEAATDKGDTKPPAQ